MEYNGSVCVVSSVAADDVAPFGTRAYKDTKVWVQYEIQGCNARFMAAYV